MPRIQTVDRANLTKYEPLFNQIKESMGFLPNSMLAMANWPQFLQHFATMAGTILGSGQLDGGLKQLIAFVSSNASGCRYCQAHTSHSAHMRGVSAEKISAAFEFETSELFDSREKAALRVALHAGMSPNGLEDGHFHQLSEFFSESEKTEIMAVISLFGFLNRWNDSLATPLEDKAMQFASSHLSGNGWQADKHKPEVEA